MKGLNRVTLIGNLGAGPAVSYTANSKTPTASFWLATHEAWADKNTHETHERVEWHRVVAYRQVASIAEKFLHTGARVYVEGKIRTRHWRDKKGLEHYITEIHAEDINLLDGANDAKLEEAKPPLPDGYPVAKPAA